MADMIEIKHLNKYFGDLHVLKDINLTVKRGEKLVMIGPSGSGKSTLIRCVDYLEEPTSGEVVIDGTPLTKKNHLEMARKYSSMVFQQFNLFPNMTILENIMLAPVKLGKMTKEEANTRAMELLKRIGLADKAGAYPAQLSGGQKQRIAIAGVIAMEPKCIVLDEPTAMLDPRGRREVIDTIGRLNREKSITVVLITHHMDEAAKAQRVVVLDKGKVAADGTPKEVFSQVELLHGIGLAAPETVELCWELNQEGFDLPLDKLDPKECAQALYDMVMA